MTQLGTANIRVALVDDHTLFRRGLSELINNFQGYSIVCDLENGNELKKVLESGTELDIIILDINIPVMSGYEIASWLKEFYPSVKVLAVSMDSKEQSILRMVKAGARGYILKDADPAVLKNGLDDIMNKGYYHSELVSASFFKNAHKGSDSVAPPLNNKEMEFLELVCSDLTYKEIADRMHLAPKTVDGYRATLFEKCNVKSRVGLALYAVRNKLINDFI